MSFQQTPGGRRPDEIDLQKLADRMKKLFRSKMRIVIPAVIIVFWLLSGIYTVGPGEVGVERMFGREYAITAPGLNYRIPWPVQSVTVVDIDSVRSAMIGYRMMRDDRTETVAQESLMLTGDENIIKVHLFIQYVIKDPADFVFRVRDPEDVLRSAAEVSLRGVVGSYPIDFTMTEGRALVQEQTREYLQGLLDDYRSGILIREARILTADPPVQVEDAFHEVVRALEDRERLVEEAEGYREDVVPRARGEAARVLAEAEAYREKRILDAQGETARFLEILKEYLLAPEVTRDRMYLEVIENTMGGKDVNLIIVDPDIGTNILPLFSLDGLMSNGEVDE